MLRFFNLKAFHLSCFPGDCKKCDLFGFYEIICPFLNKKKEVGDLQVGMEL